MATPSSSRSRVLITGVGAVAPNAVGVPAFTSALRSGRSGVVALPFHDPRLACSTAALCTEFDPLSAVSRPDLERLPRLVPMALAAAREAMTMAGLPHPLDTHSIDDARHTALLLGTGGGGIDFTLTQADAFHHDKRQSLWTITNATHGNLAGELSIRLGLHGPSLCLSTGCASSSDALGIACDLLRSDRPGSPRQAVVVGADSHVRVETLMGMELLGVLSTRNWAELNQTAASASRPFDLHRDGFVLGEGAWAVVLKREEPESPPPLLRLAGYGSTCDAHHRVRPAPDMAESARAMLLALQDADLQPHDVDAVQYHGTSTRLNDALETRAVHLALGPHATRVRGSSIKSMIGHPQGACGAAAVVAMACAMLGLDNAPPFVPPTMNLDHPDPECDLDYTPNRAVLTPTRTALINCLAFGAKNSALVLQLPDP